MNRYKPPTIDELLSLYAAGPDAMCNAFLDQALAFAALQDQVAVVAAVNAKLVPQVQELQARLNKDSHNSSKPPSSDGYKKPPKPPNLRSKSGKKPGGQPGHAGCTLNPVEKPDFTVSHVPETCSACGFSLLGAEVVGSTKHQSFDLPILRLEVTEHEAVICRCSHCLTVNQGQFPDHVRQPTQYGPRFLGLLAYLNQYQLIPLARTKQCVGDLFRHRPSEATIVAAVAACAKRLASIESAIKEAIIGAEVVNLDETGARAGKKLRWIHTAGTPELTFYSSHNKRGLDAIKEIAILAKLTGTAVHDGWFSYLHSDFGCPHSLCNAHLLREMIAVWEATGQTWTQRLSAVLRSLKRAKEAAQADGKSELDNKLLDRYRQTYRKIVAKGMQKNPTPERKSKHGPVGNGKTLSLLLRLQQYEALILRFAVDFRVPFDNNLAERDLRMVKLKQKISGCFRTENGMKHYCTIRGYISTMRKQGTDVMAGLRSIFEGKAIWPSLPSH